MEGGLSGWEAREEWFEAGLAESRRDAEEWRICEGREKDCSNGLGSKSKSERVCRCECRCVWCCCCSAERGAEGDSPFLGGVEAMSKSAMTTVCRVTHTLLLATQPAVRHTFSSAHTRSGSQILAFQSSFSSPNGCVHATIVLVFAGPCAIACFPSGGVARRNDDV